MKSWCQRATIPQRLASPGFWGVLAMLGAPWPAALSLPPLPLSLQGFLPAYLCDCLIIKAQIIYWIRTHPNLAWPHRNWITLQRPPSKKGHFHRCWGLGLQHRCLGSQFSLPLEDGWGRNGQSGGCSSSLQWKWRGPCCGDEWGARYQAWFLEWADKCLLLSEGVLKKGQVCENMSCGLSGRHVVCERYKRKSILHGICTGKVANTLYWPKNFFKKRKI
jgi:hypothetical protein